MAKGARSDEYQDDRRARDSDSRSRAMRGDQQRDPDARQREQDHDLELDRQRRYDGTFRPEDPNYHREHVARDRMRSEQTARQGQSEARGWGGGFNQEYPYTGQGRGEAYGEGYPRDAGRDPHHETYLNWRADYLRQLDGEYEAYRAEHQSKFADDFGAWRSREGGKPGRHRSSNPTAGGEEAERAKKRKH